MTRRERDRREIYCSWGRHKVLPMSHVPETFEQGTMCMECQLKIAENITYALGIPEWSAALHAHETRQRAEKKAKTEIVSRMREKSPAEGFVYYIRINEQIKIGYAADVTARMRHYPPGSELLAVEPGDRATELARHREFAPYLLRGREWFEPSRRVMAQVETVRTKHGDPAALAYKFTEKTG